MDDPSHTFVPPEGYRSPTELLDCAPKLSDPVELEINGYKTAVVFRELPQSMIDKLRAQSIAHWEIERRRRESEGEWRDVQTDLDSLRANRLDLLMLKAACLDPQSHKPAFSLEFLENKLTPDAQEFLAIKYEEFRQGLSPDRVTPELVDAFIEDCKKKDLAELWTRYGFCIAAHSAIYLVDQLSQSPTE
jgi:hypothetical protein